MKLTNEDVKFVMSRCPKDIRTLLEENYQELFLAGGFIRAVIAGEQIMDIDLWSKDKNTALKLAKELAEKRNCSYYVTKNAVSVKADNQIPVQFVTRWLFQSAREIINSFDFTVCSAAIWVSLGAELEYKYSSLCCNRFYTDLAARRLYYMSPVREEDAGGSFLRVFRYLKKGYNIQRYSLAAIIARLINKIEFDDIANETNDIEREKNITEKVLPLIKGYDLYK